MGEIKFELGCGILLTVADATGKINVCGVGLGNVISVLSIVLLSVFVAFENGSRSYNLNEIGKNE